MITTYCYACFKQKFYSRAYFSNTYSLLHISISWRSALWAVTYSAATEYYTGFSAV
jgi:hypothetical protein